MNWAAVAFALAVLGGNRPAAPPPSLERDVGAVEPAVFAREVGAVVGSAVNPAGLMVRVEAR